MMGWIRELAVGVQDAISSDGEVKVTVHSESQKELAIRQVELTSRHRVRSITFVVIPEEEREQYPIGWILVP